MPTTRDRRDGLRSVTVFLLALFLVVALLPSSAGGADDPVTGPTVTVTPTRVIDGQSVTINVRTTPSATVVRAEARLCRAGVDYPTGTGLRPPPVVLTGGANCPLTPVSSSADVAVVNTNTAQTAATPEGESFLYRVGAGVVEWTDLDQVVQRLTCDEENPCALVVYLRIAEGQTTTWKPFVTTLAYAADDPFAGCGGPAEGVLATAGPDRLTETWIGWTVEECSGDGRAGAAGRATFAGEGNGLVQFKKGQLDLVYTGGGFDEAIGLTEHDAEVAELPTRPSVAVPVGVNAAVVAVAGGVRTATNKVPFRDIRLTPEELAVLFGQGANRIEPYRAAILQRNPELEEGGLFDLTAGFQIGGYADAEVSSWYLTHYLDELAPDAAWTVPDLEVFGDDRGRPRGSHAGLALAEPSFANALSTLSGRSAVVKGLATISPGTSGAVWMLTDLTTARALGLTVVQIQNADGTYVAPTDASMRAAVDQMEENEEGILVGDPSMVAAGDGVQPYPLTFVEYAVAPTQPLTSITCNPRAVSQVRLATWLTYLVDEGQDELAAGMVPLTSELQDLATERIDEVGAAGLTGTCATTTTTAEPPPTPTTAPSGNGGGSGGEASGQEAAPSSNGSTTPRSTTFSVPIGDGTITIVDEAPSDGDEGLIETILPAFAGRAAAGWLGAVIALVVIMALHSAASAATARAQVEQREQPGP